MRHRPSHFLSLFFQVPVNVSTTNQTKLVFNPLFVQIEHVCLTWYVLEYVLRLITTPQSLGNFLLQPMSLVDKAAILPYLFSFVLYLPNLFHTQTIRMFKDVVHCLFALIIFKLCRYSEGLRSLGETVRRSIREIFLLFMLLVMMCCILSTALYFCERKVPGTQYTSIPGSFWWAIITLTTVNRPLKTYSKLNAAAFILSTFRLVMVIWCRARSSARY